MKIVVYTLGCKVNQYESDGLAYNLKKQGHDVSNELERADVYILNTCAVTNEAEKKSRQMLAKFKDLNPNAKILICGCASQKDPNQFQKLGASYIGGTANKIALADALDKSGILVEELSTSYNDDYISAPTKTRAHIKIQDGCNNFCSYCIIPYLRGRSRSRDLISIIKEVDDLSKQVKEIVITGINITDYRIDGELAFDKLIEQLKPYSNAVRFRLGSIEQGLITEDFIKKIKEANICPHFHLSLQSGSDTVLKRMNRKYKTKDFYKTIKLLRKHFKNPCITTDVIVGFPCETEKEFKQTIKFVKRAKFYNMHIFPYSLRSGTVAEKMPQVDGRIKKERARILACVNKKLNQNYINSCKKDIHTVLVEEYIDGYFVGHTENYIKCYIKEQCQLNELVQVKILKPYKDGALSTIEDIELFK